MSEATAPNNIMQISPFAPVSNSTPISKNTDKEVKFGISEPSTTDFINHSLCVESCSNIEEESIMFE